MSPQPDPVRKALYQHLSVDSELTQLASGGIHYGEAPADTPYPFAIFHLHSPGFVWSMRSAFRDELWGVKGVCRGRDAEEAESIHARCIQLLTDPGLTIEGYTLLCLFPEGGMPPLHEPDNGETIYQAGGLYRLKAEPT